jgi:hypothetical protein
VSAVGNWWSCYYRVGDGAVKYFSAQGQPAREAPAAAHPGAEMQLGALSGGVFVVLERRRSNGKQWRRVWLDPRSPWGQGGG